MNFSKRWIRLLLVTLTIFVLYNCKYQNYESELKALKTNLETNKSIVRLAHEEVWSKGNISIIDTLYAQNYIAHWVVGEDTGLDEFKKMIVNNRISFPDLNEKIIHIVAEGDFVVTHFISSGTFKECMGNIPATGKRASNPEIAIHRIENGKIAEQWTVSDRLNMLTQLGIQL